MEIFTISKFVILLFHLLPQYETEVQTSSYEPTTNFHKVQRSTHANVQWNTRTQLSLLVLSNPSNQYKICELFPNLSYQFATINYFSENTTKINYNAILPNPFLINSEHSWKSFSQLITNKTGDPCKQEKSKQVKSRIQKKDVHNDTLLPTQQQTQLRLLAESDIWKKVILLFPYTYLFHSLAL